MIVRPRSDRLASDFDLTQRHRNHISHNVQSNRIETKNLERLSPTTITFDIDQPVTEREKLERQSTSEEHVRTGPQRFIDHKERIPRPADRNADCTDNKHPRG